MKNSATLEKARAEVAAAFADGRLTSPVQYNQAIKLPYLMAVVKESFRLFSPSAAPLQRYSPPQGIVLAGTHIPGGWRVGLNPAVVMHKEVFGEDAGSFQPERWLEIDHEQAKLMDKCLMHFGAGSRSCTGKHVSISRTRMCRALIRNRWPSLKPTRSCLRSCTGMTSRWLTISLGKHKMRVSASRQV